MSGWVGIRMAHLYELRQGVDPDFPGPLVLSIYTDDDGLIQQMQTPSWRRSDAVISGMISSWYDYAQLVGSPAGTQDVTLFWDFLSTNYGLAYSVSQRS